MNARVTKAFLALGAFTPGADFRMIYARQCAVGQRTWRGRFTEIHRWYRHRDRTGFEKHFHLAQMQCLARLEFRFANRLAVDEGAIGRTTIPDQNGVPLADNLTMDSGNGRVFDGEIIATAAPEPMCARY